MTREEQKPSRPRGRRRDAVGEEGLTAKQEAFCLACVETGNASEAYRRAYDAGAMKAATIRSEASRLRAKPEVAARIEALRAELRARHAVTVDSLTAQLVMDRALAHRAGSASAAVSATVAMARLHGLGGGEKAEGAGKDGGADGPIALTINWVGPKPEAEGGGGGEGGAS